jgi:sugar lactone lactonase YvrE
MRSRLVGLLALIGLVTSVRTASAQARIWREDDRITISSFNDVAAIAFDGRRVFAATLNGLEMYDVIGRRWLRPSTLEDGYPVFERPVAAAYDPSQGGLWLATASGNLYLWSELSGRWDFRAPGSAPADLFTASQIPGNDAAWRVLRGTVTLDPQGRRWPLSAVVPADRPGTYWAGTAGGNILLADSRNLSGEWQPFGTLARGINAIAVSDQGALWFGGDGLGPRDGLTHADSALQEWTSYESFSSRAPRRAVNRILAGDTTWAAAADGVYVLLPDAREWRRIDDREGLPSSNVRVIVRTAAGMWAGTHQGLALIDPTLLRGTWRGMEGVRINGLAERNDTLWIAASNGLWIAVTDPNGVNVLAAPGRESVVQLRGQVAAVARAGRNVAVLASNGVYFYDQQWSEVTPSATQAGSRPHDLRGAARGLLVLGTRGVAEWHADTAEWTHLAVPADIPVGPIRDAVRVGEFLWVATPAGAVRLHWH